MNRTISTETTQKVGETVKLNGWVNNRRNMGKIVFLDLRDRWGIVQVVCVPAELDEPSKTALKDIRPEFVLEIEGMVQARSEKQVNEKLETGKVEVLAKKIIILAKAETPPFEIESEDRQANEELRLKYRYLDLRHERMKKNMELCSQALRFVMNFLQDKGFIYIHTPILSKSTPEGARDYLVPSRKYPGKFFALPQSPQQYKQMLMVAGMDRYFQIAPCFRDEDARADRSPGEFYQIDMEMSFVKQAEILDLTEEMFTQMIKKLWPEKKMTFKKWPRLDYDEVMKKYGTDKPDLRKNPEKSPAEAGSRRAGSIKLRNGASKNNPDELAFAWIVNFPLFTPQAKDKNSDDHFHGAKGKWAPSHHMFTRPKDEDLHLLDSDPGKVHSYQHDLILNGYEVGGGSLRIHDPKLQEKIFDLIGFTQKDKKQFEHLLRAFKFGVPPHGGIAPGFDRLLQVIIGEQSLREVIAFPLTSDARDPLMDAPSEVSREQLLELGVEVKKIIK